MNRNGLPFILLAASILVAVVFHLSSRKTPEEGMGGPAARASPNSDSGQTTASSVTRAPPTLSLDEARRKAAQSRLDLTVAALKGLDNPSEARKILCELHAYLASLPPDFASTVITNFLGANTRNAATQIGFSVGRNGFLDGHPSLRVALLDWLGQIQPARAGVVAEQILATPTDPDEWAVCLRTYARARTNFESREFLSSKTEELIRNLEWRNNPSAGFLEAFDILVHVQATESSPLLGELVADQTAEGTTLAHGLPHLGSPHHPRADRHDETIRRPTEID